MAILELALVGAIASVVTQFIKSKITDGFPRAVLAIIIALVLGGVAYLLNFLPDLKEALLGVLVLSNIAYGVIVKFIIPRD